MIGYDSLNSELILFANNNFSVFTIVSSDVKIVSDLFL